MSATKPETAILRINHIKQSLKPVFPNHKADNSVPAYALFKHVKNVVLETNTDCIASNGAYTHLCSYFSKQDVLFSNAETLSLEILASTSSSVADEDEAMDNATMFANKLRDLLPACSKVHITVSKKNNKPGYCAAPLLGPIVTLLFSNMRNIGLFVDKTIPSLRINTENIRELVSLEYSYDRNFREIADIVARSRATLETLKLDCSNRKLAWILCGHDPAQVDGNNDVSDFLFPNLLELEIKGTVGSEDLEINIPAAAPFPRLRRLAILGNYIFDDDVLFRGNEKTLKELHIQINDRLLSHAERYGVFAKGRFGMLDKVVVDSEFRNDLGGFYDTLGNVLVSLASQTLSLTYIEEFDTHFEHFWEYFKASKDDLANLKELVLPGTTLFHYSKRDIKAVLVSLTKLKVESFKCF